MIALLIISHSASIAQGVKELVEQMVQGAVPIAAAGGTLDGDLGTSVDLISQAIGDLGQPDAILALVDMGSAVMSAEMALELSGLPHLISRAPLVEGSLVAAVEATRPGTTLIEVAAIAERALEAKGLAPAIPPNAPSPLSASVPETILTVVNVAGLHMRPGRLFVQEAQRFNCTLRVRNLDRPESDEANAKSLIEVLRIGVKQGQRIAVRAEGNDANSALAAITALIESNFSETSSR